MKKIRTLVLVCLFVSALVFSSCSQKNPLAAKANPAGNTTESGMKQDTANNTSTDETQTPEPSFEAKLFADGKLFTDKDEFNIVFTADSKTLFFSKASRDYTDSSIYFSELVGGQWGEPQLAPFSSDYVEFDPFVTKDGSKIFFASNRPVEGKTRGYDLWFVEKEGDGWSEPKNLGDAVNTDYNDSFVSVAENGNLYFCSDRAGTVGSYDIYRSVYLDGQYQKPENLGRMINTYALDSDPLIAPDESFLIFTRGDLYISYQEKGEWTRPEKLGESINIPSGHEYTPGFSRDGQYFYFARETAGGREIYQIETEALKIRNN